MYTENVAVYFRSRFLLIIQKLDRISVWSSSIVGQKAVLAVQIITVKVMKKFLERMALFTVTLTKPWFMPKNVSISSQLEVADTVTVF